MSGRYFDTPRTEILPHLPKQCRRVLDLGCGTGASTALVQRERPVEWCAGVELDDAAVAIARERFDHLWTDDAEAIDFEAQIQPGSLDLVLCLDVLEHLRDPWAVVNRVSSLLAPQGRLIVSVPNIRNWKFIWRLFAKGDFHYTDSGVLDRTHLRFFTMETARSLAASGGLDVLHAGSATSYGPMEFRRILIALSGGRLEALIAKQTLVVAVRP